MAKDNDNPNDNPPELVLDEVVEVTPDKLSDDQTTFLQENVDDLSDEQKEVFKDVLKKEEDATPEEIEVETRASKKKTKKTTTEPKLTDDEIDPDDEATIGKVVKRELKPIEDRQDAQDKRSQGLADAAGVDSFIRDNPEFSKYRANALKYMSVHTNLVAGDAMHIVSAKDQQQIGAQKEREAVKKAKETASPGSTARKPKAGKVDWSKASQKEMDAKKAEIVDQAR